MSQPEKAPKLSEKHWEIMGVQTAQLRAKARELRFIAKHCERMIELMFEKAEQARIGYAEKDAYNLWRGNDIDSYMKHTNWPASMSAYTTVQEEVQ